MAPPRRSRRCCCGCTTRRRSSCSAPSSPPASEGRGSRSLWPLAPEDLEFPEGDADFPAFAGARERQRNRAFRHYLALRGFHGAGLGFRAHVAAQQLVDVVDTGELAGTVL